MTKNQIEYVKHLEQRRSNISNESLTRVRDQAAIQAKQVELQEAGRHNLATEKLGQQNLDELSRHNQASEAISLKGLEVQQGVLSETIRHNQQTEGYQGAQIIELNRHNLATEGIQSGQLTESKRHNVATEATQSRQVGESIRHNMAAESAQQQQIVETSRHNQATEQAQIISLNESQRHNQTIESESHRHNVASEITAAGQLALDTVVREQQLAETSRHNKVMEMKDYSTRVNNTNFTQPSSPVTSSPQPELTTGQLESTSTYYQGRYYTGRNGNLMYGVTGYGEDNGLYKVMNPTSNKPYIILKSGKRLYLK